MGLKRRGESNNKKNENNNKNQKKTKKQNQTRARTERWRVFFLVPEALFSTSRQFANCEIRNCDFTRGVFATRMNQSKIAVTTVVVPRICRQLCLGLATHKNQMVPILPGLLAMMLHLASSEHKMEWFENVLDESVFEATVINSVVSSLQRVHYNMHVPISARNQEN